jgi:cell division protein FtsW (lipid II flippase)
MCGPRMNKNIQLCLVACSCCIAILAVIMILVALGFKNKDIFAENSDWQAAADTTFMFTTSVAFVIIGTAVCGCMTAKHQGLLKYIFGCFLLIVTILLFVLTFVINAATNVSEDQIKDVCNGDAPVEQLTYVTSIDDFSNDWVG